MIAAVESFLTGPGGGAVAGSYTASGTTTTWVPLIDAWGSTIGLVNAANVDAGPVTTYPYDPSGTASATGSANDWPFQYDGMEKEITDPGTYYYTGGGQFYSPQLSRSLSGVGETSSSQAPAPLAMLSARVLAVQASVLPFRAAPYPYVKRARVRLWELRQL